MLFLLLQQSESELRHDIGHAAVAYLVAKCLAKRDAKRAGRHDEAASELQAMSVNSANVRTTGSAKHTR